MTSRRDYFAANCPESWIERELGTRSINSYKRSMFDRELITRSELNEYGWDPTLKEKQMLECLIRFEYADMMIKAARVQ